MKPEFFRHNDEKKRFFTLGYSQNAINDEGLFKIQSDTIRGIAENGSAVFVGRAADYVLRDMKCLDVFVCAPLEWRRQLVADRSKLSLEEAEKLIQKKDKARESWYNFFTFGRTTTSASTRPSSVSRALPTSSSSSPAAKACCSRLTSFSCSRFAICCCLLAADGVRPPAVRTIAQPYTAGRPTPPQLASLFRCVLAIASATSKMLNLHFIPVGGFVGSIAPQSP